MNSKLYISNLPPSVSEADLRLLFSRAGTVTEVSLVIDPATSQPRGSAYVTMATPEAATAALQHLHCHELGGRHITVTEARPPQEPKGVMSEGFHMQSSPLSLPRHQQARSRRSAGVRRSRGR